MRRRATEPYLEDGATYRKRWWAWPDRKPYHLQIDGCPIWSEGSSQWLVAEQR